ncbi:ROK family protein [Embleya sp. NPDC008237]|uniref:ROK family protein n=1 Tax=Embleya sp. NPDC008237 TaxID=3363978 RepID=UPI0036EE90AB
MSAIRLPGSGLAARPARSAGTRAWAGTTPPRGCWPRRESGEDGGAQQAALVLTRARHGDPAARAAVAAYARALAAGVGAMVLAMDPRLIVLGGTLPGAGAAVVDDVREHLADICYDVPPVVLSALTEEAVVVGGVEAARDLLRDGLPAPAEGVAAADR